MRTISTLSLFLLCSLGLAGEEAHVYTWDRLPEDTPFEVWSTVGVDVAWKLNGGGSGFGMDLVRVVFNRFGRGSFKRCMEFCSGAGFIGFSLLGLGVCDTLVLADVNPDNLASVNETIKRNGLEGRVSAYLSDGFTSIPDSERGAWDLVVSNPPHFPSLASAGMSTGDVGPQTRGLVDLDWVLHRRFYAAVHNFLTPGGGHVIFQENKGGSRPGDLVHMLLGTPLELVDVDSYSYLGTEGKPDMNQFVKEKMDYWYMHTSNSPGYWLSPLTYKASPPRGDAAKYFVPAPRCQLRWTKKDGESRFLEFSPECEGA